MLFTKLLSLACISVSMSSGLLVPGSSLSQRSPIKEDKEWIGVVTGGTRGIGKGTAYHLLQSGYVKHLVLSYHSNKNTAKATQQELWEAFPDSKILLVKGDLSEQANRDALFGSIDKLRAHGYGLKAFVHNSGQYVGVTSGNSRDLEARPLSFGDGSLLNDDHVQWGTIDYYLDLYGKAFIDFSERSIKRMREDQSKGAIVGISSPGASKGTQPSFAMPLLGKSVMEVAARSYALEASKSGININILIPGVTNTEAWTRLARQKGLDDDAIIREVARMSLSEAGATDPQDVGKEIVNLCHSEHRFGETVHLDGFNLRF